MNKIDRDLIKEFVSDFHALVEEVGELGKALMEQTLPDKHKVKIMDREVYKEAVQVAVMALKMAVMKPYIKTQTNNL